MVKLVLQSLCWNLTIFSKHDEISKPYFITFQQSTNPVQHFSQVRAAVEVKEEADKPYVIIVPKDFTDPTKAKQFMIDAGLWLM